MYGSKRRRTRGPRGNSNLGLKTKGSTVFILLCISLIFIIPLLLFFYFLYSQLDFSRLSNSPQINCFEDPERIFENDNKSNLTIVSIFDAKSQLFKAIGPLAFENRKLYSRNQPVNILLFNSCLLNIEIRPKWSKFLAISHAFSKGASWVWYLDSDALIANPQKHPFDLLDDSMDLLVARDLQGLNSGSMILRNSDWSKNWIDTVIEIGVTEDLHRDQDAISKYFQRHPGEKEAHVKFIEKRKINSYPSDFEKDDLVLHIPGCGGKRKLNACIENFESHARKIKLKYKSLGIT